MQEAVYCLSLNHPFDSLDIEDVDEGARLYIASAAIMAN